MPKSKLIFHIMALIVVSIWGSTLVSTKILMQSGMRADEIFLARFLIAYVVMLLYCRKPLFANNVKDELLMLVLGITGGSLYFITENLAIGLTYVNNVSFIVSTSPIITMILILMTFRYLKVKKILIIGTLIALAGVGVVIYNGEVELKLNPMGDLLSVAASLCWGVYCYLVKILGDRYDTRFVTRKVFFYGVISSILIFIFHPWQFPLSRIMEWSVLLNILFLGVVASLICFSMWSISINKLGAVTCSNYVYLIPVTTVICSAIFLDEPMTAMAYTGSALILIGVFLANQGCKDDN